MWIAMHDSARDHPKVLKLARDLGIPKVHAFGHLCSLWGWALRMAPDGDFSSFDVEDIEIGAEWEGKPGAFVAAAVSRRLLDESEHGYVIHDWEDYAEHLKAAKRKREERERKRAARKRRSATPNVPAVPEAPVVPTVPEVPDAPAAPKVLTSSELSADVQECPRTSSDNSGQTRTLADGVVLSGPVTQTDRQIDRIDQIDRPSAEGLSADKSSLEQLRDQFAPQCGIGIRETDRPALHAILPLTGEEVQAVACSRVRSWGGLARFVLGLRNPKPERREDYSDSLDRAVIQAAKEYQEEWLYGTG